MTRQVESPDDWGADHLSKFIEMAQDNTIASFANRRREYDHLLAIHMLYRDIITSLNNSPDWFCGFFLMRAHASYLAAVRLALSAQAGDVFPLLRACLESSLYGLYIQGQEKRQEIWLKRSDDVASRQRVKSEFTYRKVVDHLSSVDQATGRIASTLYERTIDYGGHPNEGAILPMLTRKENQDSTRFALNYLKADTPMFSLALRTTAQVGVCSLHIFSHVYSDRFKLLQLDDRLRTLENGL